MTTIDGKSVCVWQGPRLVNASNGSLKIIPKSVRAKGVERLEEKREKRNLRPYDEEYRRELPSTA